jgi:hypothetical protein
MRIFPLGHTYLFKSFGLARLEGTECMTQMVIVRILRSRIHISVQILQLDQIGREL